MIHVAKDTYEIGSNEYVSGGHASLERILTMQQPNGVRLALIHFDSGAVTHWHTHPGEQLLYVLAGKCRFGNDQGQHIVAEEGDTIYIPPGEKHWHGAAEGTSMSHLSVATVAATVWLEAVKESELCE